MGASVATTKRDALEQSASHAEPTALERRFRRMRMAINLEHPDRVPLGGVDYGNVHYRTDRYHLDFGSDRVEVERVGEVKTSADGKIRYTKDGGVWAMGDTERYRHPEDVLNAGVDAFPIEPVGPEMLTEMARLYAEVAQERYVLPWFYPTLVTAATIYFDWEPFLMATAMDPKRFGRLCDRFGERALSVAKGWARTEGVDLIVIHDDISATRGPILSPAWLREYAFPWHKAIFAAIHELGKKVLYISDGNTLPVLDDILANEPDGLYIESTSMDPAEFMHRAGRDMIYMLKSDARNLDHGTPEDVRQELLRIRDLHRDYPGLVMYRGGSRKPECVAAFDRYYQEYLIYEKEP